MRKFALLSTLILSTLLNSFAAHFKAGDEVVISAVEFGDYYCAGEEISLATQLEGDFTAAGEIITLQDSLFGDAMLAGSSIFIRSYISDDARLAGGEVVIDNVIAGDLIVFGGKVRLTDRGKVLGDVVCYGGKVNLYGDVEGHVLIRGGEVRIKNVIHGDADIRGGEITFDGRVMGNMTLAAENFNPEKGAYCDGSITYWLGDGERDMSQLTANAVWDEDLAMVDKEIDEGFLAAVFGFGLLAYAIIYILSAFLILLILERFFFSFFEKSAAALRGSFAKSFGYGMFYFLGFPLISLFLFVIIIGIPIAAAMMSFYVASLLFSSVLTGLCLVHYLKQRANQEWSYMQTVAYALVAVVVVKIAFVIPLLGYIAKLLAVGGAYGAFFLVLVENQRRKKLS